jgi:hypothetical protein
MAPKTTTKTTTTIPKTVEVEVKKINKRLTEAEKAERPDEYIMNPENKKYYSRKSKTGKDIIDGKYYDPIYYVLKDLMNIYPEITTVSVKEAVEKSGLKVCIPIEMGGKFVSKTEVDGTNIRTTGYLEFIRDWKQSHGKGKRGDTSAAWNNLSEDEKKEWNKKAKEHNSKVDPTKSPMSPIEEMKSKSPDYELDPDTGRYKKKVTKTKKESKKSETKESETKESETKESETKEVNTEEEDNEDNEDNEDEDYEEN